MDLLKVKPARSGMALSHPVAGALGDEGGSWPADQFTFRRIQDGSVLRDTAETADAPPAPAIAAPAVAEGAERKLAPEPAQARVAAATKPSAEAKDTP